MWQTLEKKLFLEQEGVRQSMELGLDFRGSRKSGFNRVLEKQLRGRPFRDFQVAAPLKPAIMRARLTVVPDGGVLGELFLLSCTQITSGISFPRLPSRGLIEAIAGLSSR